MNGLCVVLLVLDKPKVLCKLGGILALWHSLVMPVLHMLFELHLYHVTITCVVLS